MTQQYQVTLPKLGESIVSATIVQWFKKEGDVVQLDEPLLEVSTDKVNSEIPSPVSGVLVKVLAPVDAELEVGAVIAIIQKSDLSSSSTKESLPSPEKKESTSAGEDRSHFFSPAILRLMQEENLSLEEVQKISGTGEGKRVTKRDVEEYLEGRKKKRAPCPLSVDETKTVERVKMTGIRKAIAENMVKSFYEAPHATLITEVDVTDIISYIQKEKEGFLAKHGAKLTITPFVVQAITSALAKYPHINASLEEDTIVVKRFINVGIAVSVDQGILVPVIKNCEKRSLPDLAAAIGDLSFRARAHTLQPLEVQEGTITVTNFGISGIQIGIPIIRFPEVAIIGMGAIYKKVGVLDNDTMGIRSSMHISLTFDHRVLDGMYGCGFLNLVKENLEKSEFIR